MALPGPQGTVQYPIRAPNEHALHTKIMEKSLALFFYCYQSVVHLASALSLTPVPSPLCSPFFCPFYFYVSTSAPYVDLTLFPVFPPCGVESDLWDTKERTVSFIHQSTTLPALLYPVFKLWAHLSYCARYWACFKNVAMTVPARVRKVMQNNTNNNEINNSVGSSFLILPLPYTEEAFAYSFS